MQRTLAGHSLPLIGIYASIYSIRVAGFSLLQGYHPNPATPKLPTHIETRTHDQCGDTIEKSQAPDDGFINVRNMLSTEEVK